MREKMREKMNLTDQMNQCNSDFKMLQKRIAEKIKVIKSKQRDVDSGKYSPAVTEDLQGQIKEYEAALQKDQEEMDEAEYISLACQYILWEDEIQKRGANLPAPKKLSIFNPLRRYNNEDSIPKGAMGEILDRMIELNLLLTIETKERELIAAEESEQGTIVSGKREDEIFNEAIEQTLNETTYKKEKDVALGDIDRMRGYKKAETYDIRERLEKLAAERGRPEVSYTQELLERSGDEQER
jgi:hypothetical protein